MLEADQSLPSTIMLQPLVKEQVALNRDAPVNPRRTRLAQQRARDNIADITQSNTFFCFQRALQVRVTGPVVQ